MQNSRTIQGLLNNSYSFQGQQNHEKYQIILQTSTLQLLNEKLVLEKYYFKSYKNAQIQVLFKALVILQYFTRQIYFSRTFQESPPYLSALQACANPALFH